MAISSRPHPSTGASVRPDPHPVAAAGPTAHAVVVYEPDLPTRALAEAVTEGLEASLPCRLLATSDATRDQLRSAAFVIVGATVAGTRPPASSGRARRIRRSRTGPPPTDPGVGPPLGDWLSAIGSVHAAAAAFEVRADAVAPWPKRSSRTMGARLRAHGFELVVDPETFLQRGRDLLAAEDIHAFEWGRELATMIGSPA